jgi:dTDP-4-amino-4,6-dideoxygalactose transaminase
MAERTQSDRTADGSALHQAAPFLPFALPDIGEEEIAEVVACLRSGWVTTGPKTRQFEQEFGAYLGGGVETISVNSATAGLHLALEALGIGPGDEVIVPTLTFTATAEVVRYLGAQPVFVDADPRTLNIDPAAIAAAIGARTRAIIPVHYAGLPCDMDAILALARRHGLRVVEDAAHAFPTEYQGRLVGTMDSDITVFSFYANKTMTTGEGGMVATRNAALAARIRLMRIHGISQDAFARYVSRTPAWFYEVVAAGFKYNLTDIAAAIGIQQLRKIDRFLARRQALAAAYTEGLAGLPLLLPPDAPAGSRHAWHLYVVRLTDGAHIGRDELIARLSERGIGTSVHFIPLHRHPYWRDTCALRPEQFPVADQAFHAMLTLPLYTKMSDADLARVIAALRELVV